jgi:hypothetical protein
MFGGYQYNCGHMLANASTNFSSLLQMYLLHAPAPSPARLTQLKNG